MERNHTLSALLSGHSGTELEINNKNMARKKSPKCEEIKQHTFK